MREQRVTKDEDIGTPIH